MSAKLLMLPIVRKMTNSSGKTGSTSALDTVIDEDSDEYPQGTQTHHRQRQAKRSSSLTPSLTYGFHRHRHSHDSGVVTEAALAKDRYQLVFMGAGGVGKSALISRFLYDKFSTKYKPTVEDMYATEFPMGSDLFTLELVDTSGSMKFPAMQALNMARGDGFVLVYSITDPESFEEVRNLREEILNTRTGTKDSGCSSGETDSEESPSTPPPPAIVIVGTKSDLESERAVSTITAETIATIDWEHGFVEASSLTGENVVDIFKELLKQSRLSINRDLLFGAAMDKRRRSFPICSDAPKRRDFQRKRSSCAIN